MKKRRFLIILKLFLDNFKVYIKYNRFIGGRNIYSIRKIKIPKNFYNCNTLRKKRRIKRGYFFKWDRFRGLYLKLSPMGSYYYWFVKIEKFKYYVDFNLYFFNSILKSIYYIYILPIYILIYYSLIKWSMKINIFINFKKKYTNVLNIINIYYNLKNK